MNLKKQPTMTSHSDQTLRTLYFFLCDIGAKPDLSDKKELRLYMERFYDNLYTDNPMFPKDRPESKVWAQWMSSVMDGKAMRKGNNMSAMLQCFNNWARTNISRQPIKPDIQGERAVDGPLEEWPNDVLLNQIAVIERMGNNAGAWLRGAKGAASWVGRIEAEIEKRGLRPK